MNKQLNTISDWEKGKVHAESRFFSTEDWENIKNYQKSMFETEVERKYREFLSSCQFLLEKTPVRNDFINITRKELEDYFSEDLEKRMNTSDCPLFLRPVFNDINFDILTKIETNKVLQSFKRGYNFIDYSAVKSSDMHYNLVNNLYLNASVFAMALVKFRDFFEDFVKVDPALQNTLIIKEKKHLPDFPDLFERKNEFDNYITRLADDGFIKINRNNSDVRWIAVKVYLISFLYQLHDSLKLKKDLYSNNLQNLGKIAMIYFHIFIDKRTLQRGYYYQTRKDFTFIQK